MKNTKIYLPIGIVFMIGGLIALLTKQMGLFAAWFCIGAAFFAIGSNERNKTPQMKKNKIKK